MRGTRPKREPGRLVRLASDTTPGIEVTSTISDGNITSRTAIHYSKSGAPYTTTLTAFVKMLAADGAEHVT